MQVLRSHTETLLDTLRDIAQVNNDTRTQFDGLKVPVSHFYFLLLDGCVRWRVVFRGRPGQLWGSTAGVDPWLLPSPLFLSSQVDLPFSALGAGSSH